MDEHRQQDISRRAALRRSAALGLGTAVVWLAAAPARAQAGKLAKEAVKYVDQGNAPGKDCDDCLQYIAPASASAAPTCRIVDGPISAHGHCVAFTPKPKSAG